MCILGESTVCESKIRYGIEVLGFDKAPNLAEKAHGKFCKKIDYAGQLCSK
jgi:hypothetical protein